MNVAKPEGTCEASPASRSPTELTGSITKAEFAGLLADLELAKSELAPEQDTAATFATQPAISGKSLPDEVGNDLPAEESVSPDLVPRTDIPTSTSSPHKAGGALPSSANHRAEGPIPLREVIAQPVLRSVPRSLATAPVISQADITGIKIVTAVPSQTSHIATPPAGLLQLPGKNTLKAPPIGTKAQAITVSASAEGSRADPVATRECEAAAAPETKTSSGVGSATVRLQAPQPQSAGSVPALPVNPLSPATAAPPAIAGVNSLAAHEVPQDFEALIDRLSHAREIARPAEARLSVNHTEFGAVSIRFENAVPSAPATNAGIALNVSLRNADPEFAQAVQAALVDRPVPERADDRAADGSTGTRHDQGGSASHQARNGERQDPERRSIKNPRISSALAVREDAASGESASGHPAGTGVTRGLYI